MKPGQKRDPLSTALFKRTMAEKRIEKWERKIQDDQKLIRELETEIRELGGL